MLSTKKLLYKILEVMNNTKTYTGSGVIHKVLSSIRGAFDTLSAKGVVVC